MNAFHPQFMKTYYPNFWEFKTPQALAAEREQAKRELKPKRFFVFAQAIKAFGKWSKAS